MMTAPALVEIYEISSQGDSFTHDIISTYLVLAKMHPKYDKKDIITIIENDFVLIYPNIENKIKDFCKFLTDFTKRSSSLDLVNQINATELVTFYYNPQHEKYVQISLAGAIGKELDKNEDDDCVIS